VKRAATLARRLSRDATGATTIEFAAILPALLMALLGLMDLSYNLYTASLLEGAIQHAGRNSTIEGGQARSLAIDTRLRDVVEDIAPNATIDIDRQAYADYSEIGRPEDFTDSNADGICADGEPFEDTNRNGKWDEDRGRADRGGARDAVLYTVTVSYPRAFPVMSLLGFSDTVTSEARTVLRNQPYGTQDKAVPVGSCT
jgi:Flp pilus assembly protein TadG